MRVGIFFDGKNFHSGWQNIANAHPIDLSQLVEWLVQRVTGTDLWGAYYYTGVETGSAEETPGQQKLSRFLNAIELLPGFFVKRFNRRSRILRCQACHAENRFSQEKEVDTTMVADMLRLAAVNAFDVLLLVSGDADLAPAVEGVQSLGKKVYVASWGGSGLSQRLRNAAFDHIDLMDGLSAFGRYSPTDMTGLTPATPPDSAHAVQEVTSPQEDAARSQVVSERSEAGTEAFLDELRAAERRFSGGYVGMSYFVTRWKSDRLEQSPDIRGRLLDRLVEQNRVEIYVAPDGAKAIRIKTPDPTTR